MLRLTDGRDKTILESDNNGDRGALGGCRGWQVLTMSLGRGHQGAADPKVVFLWPKFFAKMYRTQVILTSESVKRCLSSGGGGA